MMREVSFNGGSLKYILIRSQRHDVLLKALPEGQTRVFAPSYMHLKDIDRLVEARAAELSAMHRALDEKLRQSRLDHPVREGSAIRIEGQTYCIHLLQSAKTDLAIAENAFVLALPEPENEEKCREAIRHALSKRALNRIRERLAFFAPKIGVEFGRVAIRDQKSRWGSCSDRHNLNFNWKLIMAPPEVLDYVVIHELCHLIEFNHSKRFWALVENQMPEYEVWKRWLKNHGAELGV